MIQHRRANLAGIAATTLGLVGLAAAAALVWRMGPSRIAGQVAVLGAVLPLVLAITGLRYPVQAAAWRLALAPERRPPFGPSVSATVAGDAVGYLTIAGPLTGEPLRALLLQPYLPVAAGIAAGALERTLYALSGTLVIGVALAIAALRVNSPRATAAVVVGATLVAAGGWWVLRRRPVFARQRDSNEGGWRATLADLWIHRRSAVGAIVALTFIQHVLLLLEAWVMLDALGASPSFSTVVVFEGVTKLVNAAGTFVPGRLGISEGGGAALAAALQVGASFGLSLALMRRIRALLWGVAGLALWAVELGLRRRRSNPEVQG